MLARQHYARQCPSAPTLRWHECLAKCFVLREDDGKDAHTTEQITKHGTRIVGFAMAWPRRALQRVRAVHRVRRSLGKSRNSGKQVQRGVGVGVGVGVRDVAVVEQVQRGVGVGVGVRGVGVVGVQPGVVGVAGVQQGVAGGVAGGTTTGVGVQRSRCPLSLRDSMRC